MRRALAPLLALALLVAASPALAQTAAVQVAEGPYYTGTPIDLHVVLDGFEEEPSPEVSAAQPDGATLTFVQARPQVSSMMQILNGRITQSREVKFVFAYQVTANKAGTYRVGPFQVKQGGALVTTKSVDFNVVDVPQAGGQKLRVIIPDHPVFIGQRVPVTVEWWTEDGLADRLYNQRLSVPLFHDTASFQFLDEEREPSRIAISVELPGGAVDFPADLKQISEGGKRWVVRSFSRTLVPVATGSFDLGIPTLFCEEATAFRRDLFGSRVPSRSRRVRVSAPQQTLTVDAVPAAGRPASFAGAIGQGFALEVAADRTVLQAGDPVTLTFTIRGDGPLDSAALPPLAAAGLSPAQFRLPDGQVAGITDAGSKRFEATVRVIDANVTSIPPIEYSWFDPSTGKFESTRSQPIALSVRAATIVGAGDVVSATPAAAPAEDAPSAASASAAAAAAPAFTLTGADLSVETDPARLRSNSTSLLGAPALAVGGYAGGVLALLAGFFVRRRRTIDPVQAAFAKQMRGLRSSVASDRGVKEVADALRKMAALRGDSATRVAGIDDVLARLDETTYAPGGAAAEISAQLRTKAVAVADSIVKENA